MTIQNFPDPCSHSGRRGSVFPSGEFQCGGENSWRVFKKTSLTASPSLHSGDAISTRKSIIFLVFCVMLGLYMPKMRLGKKTSKRSPRVDIDPSCCVHRTKCLPANVFHSAVTLFECLILTMRSKHLSIKFAWYLFHRRRLSLPFSCECFQQRSRKPLVSRVNYLCLRRHQLHINF